MADKDDRRYEADDVAVKAMVEGWSCTKCRRFFGNEEGAERMARWCCCTSMPCDCGGRYLKLYTCCEACRDKKDAERFHNTDTVEWDGKTPLCTWRGDQYFWSAEEVDEHLHDHGIAIADAWLEVCRPTHGRPFSVAEFLYDDLPEDVDEIGGEEEIDKLVNEFIQRKGPLSWTGSGKRPSIASLREHLEVEDASDE